MRNLRIPLPYSVQCQMYRLTAIGIGVIGRVGEPDPAAIDIDLGERMQRIQEYRQGNGVLPSNSILSPMQISCTMYNITANMGLPHVDGIRKYCTPCTLSNGLHNRLFLLGTLADVLGERPEHWHREAVIPQPNSDSSNLRNRKYSWFS